MAARSSFLKIVIILGFLFFTADAIISGGDNTLIFAQKSAGKQADTQSGVPVIDIPEPSYDCGRVPQDSACTHIFKIRNIGTAPLKLIKAKGS